MDETKNAERIIDVLNTIEDALLDPAIGADVWSIIEMMRGPDVADHIDDNSGEVIYSRKRVYCVPIRCAAFPRIAASASVHEGRLQADFQGWSLSHGKDHYENHAQQAESVLRKIGRPVADKTVKLEVD